jgi:hypothetical protein
VTLSSKFFPDRPAALAELLRVPAPGGRLGASVFGPIERNPAPNALADALDRRMHAGASTAKRTSTRSRTRRLCAS